MENREFTPAEHGAVSKTITLGALSSSFSIAGGVVLGYILYGTVTSSLVLLWLLLAVLLVTAMWMGIWSVGILLDMYLKEKKKRKKMMGSGD